MLYGKLVEGVGVLEVMGYLVSECKVVVVVEGVILVGDVDVVICKIIEIMFM